MIQGLAEVVLNVTDLARMRAFYRDVIGLAVVSEGRYTDGEDGADNADGDDATPTICFLRVGAAPAGADAEPAHLVLIDPSRHALAAGRFDAIDPRRSTLNHVAFRIDASDHVAEVERLASLGLEPVVREFPGIRARGIFVRDPEGNTVELVSPRAPGEFA